MREYYKYLEREFNLNIDEIGLILKGNQQIIVKSIDLIPVLEPVNCSSEVMEIGNKPYFITSLDL